MEIKSIEVTNFMGMKGYVSFDVPHIAALVGPNGIGKSTILAALRYGLTGEEPDGDIINLDCDETKVVITLTDPTGEGYAFSRSKHRTKPSKCTINGKATTQKALNDMIETVVGIPLDKIKVLSSAEIVAAMKPQEFGSFILDYVPEKPSLEKVLSLIPEATLGMTKTIEANLPETDISMKDIEELDKTIRATRKEMKDALSRKKALYDGFPKEAPEGNRKELEDSLAAIANQEADYRAYKAKKDAYDKTTAIFSKTRAQLADIKREAEEITDGRPDSATRDKLAAQASSVQETLQNTRLGISSAQRALEQLCVSLENLESPVCPLSDKIKCCQDKSAAKADLEESIESTKEGIAALEVEATKAAEQLEKIRAELAAYDESSKRYEKKITLLKRAKELEESLSEEPTAPEAMEEPDTAALKAELTGKLRVFTDYEEGCLLAKQIAAIEAELSDLEALVKALAEKGPVRTGILESYLGVFEEICNERSAKFKPGAQFRFVSDDGVVVLMTNEKGVYLPYESLSGGERAYMIFIIMDMLNSLCGSRILFLDELSVMDPKAFDTLIEIIADCESGYDHILLAAVNHEETVKTITSHGIRILEL